MRVRERAILAAAVILRQRGAPPGTVIRLVPDGRGSVAFRLAPPSFGDRVFQHLRTPVLALAADLVPLRNLILDATLTPDGPRLRVGRRPDDG